MRGELRCIWAAGAVGAGGCVGNATPVTSISEERPGTVTGPRSRIASKSNGDRRIKGKMTKNHLLSEKCFPQDAYFSSFVV